MPSGRLATEGLGGTDIRRSLDGAGERRWSQVAANLIARPHSAMPTASEMTGVESQALVMNPIMSAIDAGVEMSAWGNTAARDRSSLTSRLLVTSAHSGRRDETPDWRAYFVPRRSRKK